VTELNKKTQPLKPHSSLRFLDGFGVLIFFFIIFCQLLSGVESVGIQLDCSETKVTAFQGEKVVITFSATNHMKKTIRHGSNHFLSYHIYDAKGKLLQFDNRRYNIPRVLRRRKTVSFQLPMFFSYPKPGDYIIQFDIVNEGQYWGSHKKWQTCRIKLKLKSLISPEFKNKYLTQLIPTGNPLLDQEQYLLRITLNNCQVKTSDGNLFGFAAGSDYPQVWIRDTATFIAYAKLFYSFDELAPGIEMFMAHQGHQGDIVDWIDLSGKVDKNTVETDQESSLVLAAYQIATSNPKWLTKKINNKTILQRLDLALQWVWQHKRNKKYQLIYSGFTADWGDNENTYPDQRATKLSPKSTLVFGIYTQAKYLQAIDALINMAQIQPAPAIISKKRIQQWQQRRRLIQKQAQKVLYLKDKGYYITHIVPTEDKEKYFKMESEMLPVGGNAEAILAGLMDKSQTQRFLHVLQQRRKEYKLRTVSFTLLPPYPEGFFPHHLLFHPWSYQNGGEWDWIGARVVKALLFKGFPKEALEYLLEIVKKNLANFCIYEWEDRQGTGRGALFYVGAAGVIGDAIQQLNKK
jgi:hypothetical protein